VGETVSSSSIWLCAGFLKGLVACCRFYFILFIFTFIEQTYNNYYSTRRVPSCCPHGFRSGEGLLHGVPSRDLNPGLPYSQPTRNCMSHAAPCLTDRPLGAVKRRRRKISNIQPWHTRPPQGGGCLGAPWGHAAIAAGGFQ
jgi:hypothetical protein